MDERLRLISARDGAFLRREALAVGYDDRKISELIRQRIWVRVRRGAYAFAADWEKLDAHLRFRTYSRVAIRQARCRVVASHSSALAEYGTASWGVPSDEAHMTRFDGRSGRREAGVAQHKGSLTVEDVTIRDGRYLTSGTRAALDLTTILDTERSVVAVDGLIHAGETTTRHLTNRLDTMDCWPNTLHTDLVLRLARGKSASVGESRTLFAIWGTGIPAPQQQHEVRDRGILLAELDFAWPEHRVWLEFDGVQKYVKFLREGETIEQAVLREKQREDLVRRVTGWMCLRITWAELDNPALLAFKIRQLIADRAAAA